VDNAFPTPFDKGPGSIIFKGVLKATGELRIYTVRPSQNTFLSPINGVNFVSGAPFGIQTLTEEWMTYFPSGTYQGGPFKIYYKNGFTPAYYQTVYQAFVATAQLSDLLKPIEIYDLLDSIMPRYNGFICYPKPEEGQSSKCCGTHSKQTICVPGFNPYQSLIFENALYWIPSVQMP
jgi:hypothetical protein